MNETEQDDLLAMLTETLKSISANVETLAAVAKELRLRIERLEAGALPELTS